MIKHDSIFENGTENITAGIYTKTLRSMFKKNQISYIPTL